MAIKGSTGQHASGEGVFIQGETTAWNIAEGFTKINVLKILIEINLFERIAFLGRQDMEEEVPFEKMKENRINALKNIPFVMRQVIDNCRFRIKKMEDRLRIHRILRTLKRVEGYYNGTHDYYYNELTKEETLKINEVHFMNCLNALMRAKAELHIVLDKVGLIFKLEDEPSIDEFMQSIYEG